MKYYSIALPLLLIVSLLNAQTPLKNKPHIAFLGLSADGLTSSEIQTLSNHFRNELVNTGSFIVLERSVMNDILKEQGFQLGGCTNDECAVKAGKLLNVKEMVAGSVGKVGTLYSIDARLIDVETGEIVKSVAEYCQCPIERVLTQSIKKVALKLAGRIVTTTTTNVLEEGKGDLFIKTEPSGAKIYLDNNYTHKFSPATLKDLAAGKHFVKVTKGNFIGTKSVTVKTNNIVTETVQLEQAKGNLKVYSNPPEAEIFIDGHSYGKTPMIVKDLSAGEHQVIFKLEKYEKKLKTVYVAFNRFTKVDARLKKLGSLEIQSDPSGAEIFIDSQSFGKTPKTIHTFASGHYTVFIRKDGYGSYQSKIEVKAENKIRIFANLKKLIALSVHSKPSGAIVFIDDQVEGKTPLILKLEPGKPYHIKLSKTLYSDWERTLTPTEGESMRISPYLENKKGVLVLYNIPDGAFITINGKKYQVDKKEIPLSVGRYVITISRTGFISKSFSLTIQANQKKAIYAALKKKTRSGAFVRSLFIPGWGQSYQGKSIRSWLFRLSFAGSAAGAYIYMKKYNTFPKKSYDKRESVKKIRDIFFKSTVAVWVVNVLDALILPPAWNNNVHISGRIENKRIWAGLNIRW